MKKPLLFLVFFCICLAASAQKVYFIYFQSEEQAPFYVKFKNKVFNSGSAGYVIIPNLQDSAYQFMVGFSTNTSLESKYTINIDGEDKGLLLKKFEEGPALFDLQKVAIIKPDVEENTTSVAYETKTDKFSTVLSKAAEDPSLVKVPIHAKKEEPKPDDVKKAKETVVSGEEKKADTKKEETLSNAEELRKEEKSKTAASKIVRSEEAKEHPLKQIYTDSSATSQSAPEASVKAGEIAQKEEQKSETPVPAKVKEAEVVADNAKASETFKRSYISRYSETSTTEGFGVVYYDIYDGQVDTIRLLIPNTKVAIAQSEAVAKEDDNMFLEIKKEELPKKKNRKKDEARQDIVKKDEVKNEGELPSQKETEEARKAEVTVKTEEENIQMPVVVAPVKSSAITNPSCLALASERDFFRLRKNMAGKETDEGMIEEAKKAFRKSCYSTEQLRHLSSLFLTSAGKYQFFDAAYSFASDKENFASLGTEIRDSYYLKRFKALIGE